MNMDLIANILVIATVLFIGFWLVMLVGWMKRPGASARKPLGERNERNEWNERTELNELEGRSIQPELNELTGRKQRTGLTELNELNRNHREGDEH